MISFNKLDRFNKNILFLFLGTVMTGALRKWIFTSGAVGNVILGLQLLLPYVFFSKDRNFLLPFTNKFFSCYLILLIIEMINPLNLTLFHGCFGLILHLGFWFTTYFYVLNRDKIDLIQVIPIILVILFGEIILGFIQYGLPPTHILNKYATDAAGDIALVGSAVRVTGTFSYIGGYTAIACFMCLFFLVLVRYNYNAVIISLLGIGGFLAALMSGSRSAVGFYFIMLIVFFINEINIKQIGVVFIRILIPIVVLITIVLALGTGGLETKIATALDNFNERRETGVKSGEENQRILWDLNDLIDFRGKYPFFGVGLGSTYQGATAVFGTSEYVQEYGYYENELARIVLEGGFVLLIFRLILMIYLFSFLRVKLLTKIALFILIFYFNPIVFNIYNSVFFSLGLIFIDNSYQYKQGLKKTLA
ncbi:O-antigen ligase family protein [Chitinophagaceae bacterium LWZ2-11]